MKKSKKNADDGPLTKSTPLKDSTQDLIDSISKLEASEFVVESDTIHFETPLKGKILKSAIRKSPQGLEAKSVRIKEEEK